MPAPEPGKYRLSPRAFADLEDIWRHSAEIWSPAQADRYLDSLVRIFDTIAAFPTLARERPEFTAPVRIHVHDAHLVVYVIAAGHIVILRLLGGRQDWLSILNAAEP